MADTAPAPDAAPAPEGGGEGERGGFGRGRGRGDRGRGRGDRGRGRGRGRGGRGGDKEEWTPVTKLGRLVKAGMIKSLEEIFLFSLPIKEPEIVDQLFPPGVLLDEVMSLKPIQKQTTAGQRTRFKAYVAIGDNNGHVGLGWKAHAEVAGAIAGALKHAKGNIVPVRRGFWGRMRGQPHTVPVKLSASSGSVRVRLIPAPRGTGLVASPTCKQLLTLAGITDCYSSSKGQTCTMMNYVRALWACLAKSYTYLDPSMWKPTVFNSLPPFQEHTDFLAKSAIKPAAKKDDDDSY